MITIFQFLNDILTSKQGNLLGNVDDENFYQPFLVNRWISFYSPLMTRLINNTVNRYWPILQHKQDHYRFLVSVLPQVPQKRIIYIKKVKPEKEKDYSHVIAMLAQNLQMSQREVTMYVEEAGLDLEPYSKALKTK